MNTLGWAVFLAVSWTWCIGMYLPSLMVRDGGVPFFLAFFIPNVLGAASVGWLFRDGRRSQRFTARLRPVLLAFSAVTIAFHAFFLAWQAGEELVNNGPYVLGGMLLGASLVGNAIAARRRVDWVAASLTLGITLAFSAVLAAYPPGAPLNVFGPELLGLAMVTTLGFGLCPYLDLTFNRAAQRAANPRAAFTIGFFIVFAATILLATRGRVIWMPAEGLPGIPGEYYLVALGMHFAAQATFTVAAHVAAARRTDPGGVVGEPTPTPPRRRTILTWPLVIGAGLGVAAYAVPGVMVTTADGHDLKAHEIGYRVFLAAYGLVFPAWILLTMRGQGPLTRGTLAWLAATCVAATPFYTVGMIALRETWLIPGVGIVLGAAGVRHALGRARGVGN